MTSETTKKLPSFAEGFPTPPDHVLDSFAKMDIEQKPKVAPVQTPLSPVSPAHGSMPSFTSSAGYIAHDEPLYPDTDRSHASDSQAPLFTDVDAASPARSERTSTTSLQSPSTQLAVPFKGPNIGNLIGPSMFIENSRKGVTDYYWSNMAQLDRIRAAHATLPKPVMSAAARRDPVSTRQVQSLGKPTGVSKARSPPKPVARPKAARAASPAKAASPPKRTPKTSTLQDFHDTAFPSSQSSKHKRAAPTKKTFDNDSEWRAFEDFCPPISSLDSAPKPLKAAWKGSPMDISQDADKDELHPAELGVAAELRLHPVQYLANKRRMFIERVKRMREGQSFTKTAAQNVCNVDVNKVSKLWEAFDRVGWFDEKWFEKYL